MQKAMFSRASFKLPCGSIPPRRVANATVRWCFGVDFEQRKVEQNLKPEIKTPVTNECPTARGQERTSLSTKILRGPHGRPVPAIGAMSTDADPADRSQPRCEREGSTNISSKKRYEFFSDLRSESNPVS